VPRGVSRQEQKAAENTRRLIVLIVSSLAVLVELGLGAWGLQKAKQIQEGEGDSIVKLRADLAAQRAEIKKAEDALLEFSRPLGWSTTVRSAVTPHVSRAHDPAQLKAFLDATADLLEAEHGNADAESVHKRGLKGKYARWSDAAAPPDKRLTLVKLFPELLELYQGYDQQARARLSAAAENLAQAQKTWDEGKAAVAQYNDEKNTTKGIKPKTEALATAERQLVESEAAHQLEIRQAQANLAKKKEEHNNEIAKIQRASQELLRREQDLRDRIKVAEYKKAEASENRDADATVLSADNRLHLAHLDLGLRDRVFPGTLFHVFRIIKGGVRKEVGTLEVLEVGEEFAVARIVSPDGGKSWPEVQAGDRAFNEFYERGRARNVVFAGRVLGPFSREDLMGRLQALGDRVQEKLDDATDLVVAGDGFLTDPNYLKAVAGGVRVITEKYFYTYLGLPYTPRGE
jgi:hypothetical protein